MITTTHYLMLSLVLFTLDAHQDGDEVAANRHPDQPESEEDERENEVVRRGDHAPPSFGGSLRPMTIAPIIATRRTIETTSNGSR